MSKFDDFWNDIAPTQKEGETPPGANTNTNADLETALAKANNEIENLKKMISELKPNEEPTNKETETETEVIEEENENE